MGEQIQLSRKADIFLKMSETRNVEVATLAHIRDLEEYLERRRTEIADMSEDQEQYGEMKDDEVKYLLKEKEIYNQKMEARKETIKKEMEDIGAKIRMLFDTVKGVDHEADIESRMSPAEDMDEEGRRPQGLRTVV